MIEIDEIKYELIINEKEGYNEEEFLHRYSDYFKEYDYIVGDWAYGKLRLKGFCKKENKLFKPLNDYANVNDYLDSKCAFGCKHFIVEKK